MKIYGKEKPYIGKEDNFQKATNTAFKIKYKHLYQYAFHVPNGGKRPDKTFFKKGKLVKYSAEGKKLKEMGTKSGVSDWLVLYPHRKYHGMIIELKTKGNNLQKTQKEFLEKMQQVGYFVAVCYSLDGFHAAIMDYFSMVE